MYLVPQKQLDRLKNDTKPLPLRQSVENELDVSMKNVLSKTDLTPHEKVKQYTALLQRFLALVKQGELDTNTLTLSLPQASEAIDDPQGASVQGSPPGSMSPTLEGDLIASEVLKNVSSRSKKNAEYILEKMYNSQGVASWDDTGTFVFNGEPSPEHMYLI